MYWFSAPSSSLSIFDRISMTSGLPFMCFHLLRLQKPILFSNLAPVEAAIRKANPAGHRIKSCRGAPFAEAKSARADPDLCAPFLTDFAQTGSLATQLAQVVELGAAHAA